VEVEVGKKPEVEAVKTQGPQSSLRRAVVKRVGQEEGVYPLSPGKKVELNLN
jgi:hypothetical protein